MSRLQSSLLIVSLCFVLLSASSDADAHLPAKRGAAALSIFNSPSDMPYVPGEVIAKLHSGVILTRGLGQSVRTDQPSLDAALTQVGARDVVRVFDSQQVVPDLARVYRFRLDAFADVLAAVAALSADPNVEYAEPNYLAYAVGMEAADMQRISGWDSPYPFVRFPSVAVTTPNDPLYASQWGLVKINATSAWDVVTGTPTVVLAVVDSGIDTSHADLASQLWANPGEIPSNGTDDDNNGYVDDVNGWNFVSGSNDVSDGNGHGTQVAGVIAAATNNGQGIAGMCWNCRIMSVKVMADSGAANYSDIAAGVAYAAAKGAKVINLSLGGYANSNTLRDAINAAVAQGAVVVGGAGNDNTSALFYPAAYENVLAVAGTTITDTKATFSNYGAWVDVSAPGETITTTFLGGDYGPASGTSLSAPFVSGLAGLIRSHWPSWSEAMVRNQILRTSDVITETLIGTGRINAAAAMQDPHPLLTLSGASVNGDPQGRPTPGVGATLAVALRNDWQDATDVMGVLNTTDAYVTMLNGAASYGTIASGGTETSSPVYSFTVASSAGYNHPIAFTLAVTANAGIYTTTIPLTVTTRSGDEPFCGTVAENLTWTNDKTYIINCNVGIAPGYTLTIQPGTQIKFNGNYALNVGGTLIADGTADQMIRFTSNLSGTWNHINFDNSSTDAVVDVDYQYVAGSILRHVVVDRAAFGIACTEATPYLSHVTLAGGLICAPGTLAVGSLTLPGTGLVLDSNINAWVMISGTGNARLWGNTMTDSGVVALGQASMLTNSVNGNVWVGSGSLLQNNTVTGGIDAGPLTNVIANSVTGGSINISNSAGEAEQLVLSNTIKGGGISVGLRAIVSGNDIQNASGWAINGSGIITATGNRVMGNGNGINVGSGLVQGNLIANSGGVGLQIGSVTVLSNTFTGNAGSAIKITSGTSVTISGNNFEFNAGQYDVEDTVSATNLPTVSAQRNWWGTTNSTVIGQRIFDFGDDYNIGAVVYSPVLTRSSADAPAYVRAITLTPASPVGIQTVAFDVLFSRAMDTNGNSTLDFYTTQRGTWHTYSTTNSGLADDTVRAIAVDAAGGKWFGTNDGGVSALRADGTWQTYNLSNSELASNSVYAIAVDTAENEWFGTWGGGVSVLRADGSWQTYNPSNSGLASNNVFAIAIDAMGNKWFGTWGGGVSVLRADGSWQTYNMSNSGLANNDVQAIAEDAAGNKWFGTSDGGVSALRVDGSWQTYNQANSGLANNNVRAIAVDAAGGKWFGTSGVSVLHADGTWQTYNTFNSGLARDDVWAIALDAAGNRWFGTWGGGVSVLRTDGSWQTYNSSNSVPANYFVWAIAVDAAGSEWFGTRGGGVSVLYSGTDYAIVDNSQWLSPTNHYRATYDFSTLIPRGAYSLTVSGANGADGMEIAPYSGGTFTVDYAGAINDTTLPPAPSVSVDICQNSTTTTYASWSAYDPNSAITLYRYALGTAPNGTDVINWTDTPSTSVTRTGLNLMAGQRYYFSVKARNAGGLWSVPSSGGFTAGVPCNKVYLPLVMRSP